MKPRPVGSPQARYDHAFVGSTRRQWIVPSSIYGLESFKHLPLREHSVLSPTAGVRVAAMSASATAEMRIWESRQRAAAFARHLTGSFLENLRPRRPAHPVGDVHRSPINAKNHHRGRGVYTDDGVHLHSVYGRRGSPPTPDHISDAQQPPRGACWLSALCARWWCPRKRILPLQSPCSLGAAVGRGSGWDAGPVHPANDTTSNSPAAAARNPLDVITRPS